MSPHLIEKLCRCVSQLPQVGDVGLELFQGLRVNHASHCSITTPPRWVWHLQRERRTRLLSNPAGVPVTPTRHRSAFCSKKVIIKRGENPPFSISFFFLYLKSDNQALQLSLWRPYFRRRKQPALLQSQQPTVKAIPLLLSRVLLHISLNRRRPAGREEAEN